MYPITQANASVTFSLRQGMVWGSGSEFLPSHFIKHLNSVYITTVFPFILDYTSSGSQNQQNKIDCFKKLFLPPTFYFKYFQIHRISEKHHNGWRYMAITGIYESLNFLSHVFWCLWLYPCPFLKYIHLCIYLLQLFSKLHTSPCPKYFSIHLLL